ncbi:uncharacterized protein LOC124491357 [Dermatophagoides farinae]|uniref:Uncharacterized protein n=1 Tax=Dermatophagoides farinae TaxID=6954 RepID=A0A922IH38_DERFA|nr:uncharacterized protein LOC124491357 [Dermatophagoides farinae]KAH9530114.1 hypothetical protein DERF_003945 [Dermatophagoides farinae]
MGDPQQQPSTSGIKIDPTTTTTTTAESSDTTNVMASNTAIDARHVVGVDEFLNTGRTGRRNALGDILDENSAYLTTAELPDQLSSLSFESDQSCSLQSTPSTSNCHPSSSSSSS